MSNRIKKKMEDILEDEEILKQAEGHRMSEIEEHVRNQGYLEEIESIKQYKIYCKSNSNPMFRPTLSEGCLQHLNMDVDNVIDSSLEYLEELQLIFKDKLLSNQVIEEIKGERLDVLLRAADVDGDSFEDRNSHYIEALKISTKGYSVILKRDVSETMINNYNSEWIKAWSGNMDLQVCLDFFAVITYITDYYLKDETGTLKFIQQALEGI